ncbi:MAG: S41 family peptidase, partial [Chloroflexota bacterium]
MTEFKKFSPHKKAVVAWPIVLLLLIGLGGCGVYNGYPTPVPVTASPDDAATTPIPTLLPLLTFASLPTVTPRPTLPPTPSNLSLKKGDFLQQSFNGLLSRFYKPLASADIYEVGLIGMQKALKEAGVSQPDVPIPAFSGNAQQDFQTFLNSFTITLGRYSSSLTEDKLAYAALQNSAATINDCQVQQTAFYPPDQSEAYLRNRSGQNQYTGLGINILAFDTTSGYFITRVATKTPAEQSGLKLGDAILAVDSQDVTKMDAAQVVRLLQGNNGAVGSKVRLTLHRAGTNREEIIEVARNVIQTPFIEQRLLPDNIAYIRFNLFPLMSADSYLNQYLGEFDRLLTDFKSKGVKGYILDVRGTRYGNIALVQNLLSRFVSGQDLVYLLRQSQQGNSEIIAMPSINSVKPVDLPVAVLVDQGTSNEAEIFAQALQNKNTGSVFGVKTAGCLVASIPTVLADNSVLNVSNYRGVSDSKDPTS